MRPLQAHSQHPHPTLTGWPQLELQRDLYFSIYNPSSFLLLLAKELFLCMAAVMVRVGEGCRISLSVLLKIVTEE